MVSCHKWYRTSHGYVAKTDGSGVYLHRLVNRTPEGLSTDHINGDRLDCTRENLRTATAAQNSRNQNIQRGEKTSRFKGVFFSRGRGKDQEKQSHWIAYITLSGKRKYLGHFATEFDAALAYNQEAVALHGEFAKLNKLPQDFENKETPTRWVRPKQSAYFGVSRHVHGLWFSCKTVNKVYHHFGYHKTDKEAAIAYNQGVKELLGDKAKLNVIL